MAPILVVTGGKAEGDRTTEAAAARAYALARGIPEAAILSEDRGRTTLESLENVRELFRAGGLSSAVFVSDRTHMLRVLRIATDQGIEAWGSPVPRRPGRRRSRSLASTPCSTSSERSPPTSSAPATWSWTRPTTRPAEPARRRRARARIARTNFARIRG